MLLCCLCKMYHGFPALACCILCAVCTGVWAGCKLFLTEQSNTDLSSSALMLGYLSQARNPPRAPYKIFNLAACSSSARWRI
ncbi:hypothetical protein F5Y17DRAFT_273334 [Xylariaceae sp. FL0594]|nr:hypothetical protein F5Y17DRAFT_273334 [Xylariaceae sp. FL0594]